MRRIWNSLPVQMAIACLWACGWGSSAGAGPTIYWAEYTSGFGAVRQLQVDTGQTSTLVTGTGYGPGGNHIDYPISLAVDGAGSLYVGNANNGDIVKVTPQGAASDYFAVEDPTHYPHSYGLAFDPAGNLYIAQLVQGTVAKLAPGAAAETVLASGLDAPQAGACDPDGNAYVMTSETLASAIAKKITPSGDVSTFAEGVTGIYWDAAKDLYLGHGDGTLTLTTPGGQTTTLASGLTFPIPLGLDAQGGLYVWETGTKRVLDAISPTGVLTTFAAVPNATDVVVAVPEPCTGIPLAAAILVLRMLAPWRRRGPCREWNGRLKQKGS